MSSQAQRNPEQPVIVAKHMCELEFCTGVYGQAGKAGCLFGISCPCRVITWDCD